MSGWGDVAQERNGQDMSDYRGGNPAWRHPKFQKKGAWDAPGHERMFHDSDGGDSVDDPKKSFTTRKKHGWWGKEERYDMQGRKLEE